MCGITGFVTANPGDRDLNRRNIRRMAGTLVHRGPDASGIWQSHDASVNFGHTRLAIIDTSDAGLQPMRNVEAGTVLIYNGEIYNYAELKVRLMSEGVHFRGHCDTEVLLQALTHWGVERTLPLLNGMFAFALWNERARELWLARDRFGEKPLYYSHSGSTLVFGSELKSLAQYPDFSRDIDRNIIALYLRFNYVPAPYCIFRDTWKLLPAHFIRYRPGTGAPVAAPYWSLSDLIARRQPKPFNASLPESMDELEHTLSQAVSSRMVSDVPLGAFLSGGIDSSLIVALMQKHSTRRVSTFTVGFWDRAFNEAQDAAKVARHLATEHHDLYLSTVECIAILDQLPSSYDEPFADSSQIPTILLSAFTRRHVTVALTGDAGDELFAGYNRYFWSARMWNKMAKLPVGLRQYMARRILSQPPAFFDRLAMLADPVLPMKLKVRNAGDKLHKVATALTSRSSDELYRSVISMWRTPEQVLAFDRMPPVIADSDVHLPMNFVERMMYLDLMTYLPDDILCKVDRASMSVGLETRIPFLDNNLVALAWSYPCDSKIHRGIGKWPLRTLLTKYVPAKLFERPKTGFGIPLGDWLRRDFRDWAESLLTESSLNAGGFFRTAVVRDRWKRHLTGTQNLQHSLWGVLMFEAWHRAWKANRVPVGTVL